MVAVKDKTGRRIYDEENTKKVVADYYRDLYSPRAPEPDVTDWISHVNKKVEDFQIITTYDQDDSNKPIEMEEIIRAIQASKNNKAPGLDDVPNEFFKYAGEISHDLLLQIFQNIFETEIIPTEWSCSTIVNLYKGEGDTETLNNYRGITLTSCLRKLFERVLDHRVKEILEYTEMQVGGRQDYGPCDQIFILNSIINQAVFDKKKLYIAFIDITKAYDKTWANGAMYNLWNQGVKGKLWRLMRQLNKDNSAQIRTKFGLTEPIKLDGNLGQGSVLSVCQFSNLIDQLAKDLATARLGAQYGNIVIPSLLLMDDIAVFENSRERFQQHVQAVLVIPMSTADLTILALSSAK